MQPSPAQFAKSYRAMAVSTASPGQLILMLYDGALRSTAIAINGFQEPDLARRYELINNNLFKAQEVLLVAPRDKLLDFFYRNDPLERHLLTSGPMIGRGSRLPVSGTWPSAVVTNGVFVVYRFTFGSQWSPNL